MTDPFSLSSEIAAWRKLVSWHWDDQCARVPERLRLVAEGRSGEGAAAMRRDLHYFAIVQPAETAHHFGVLAPTLDAAVTANELDVGTDKPVGAHEISLASVGNVLECLGFAIAQTTWSTIRGWIPRFEVARDDKRVAYYWNASLTAIALGAREGTPAFEPGSTFQMNMRGFIDHLAGAVKAGASADDVLPAFHELVANYPRYVDGDAADEATLMWSARIVHHQLGGQRLATTAQFIHDTIWKLAGESA